MEANYYVHPSSYIDIPCEIGEGTKIWHFCHVMAYAKIGKKCVLEQNVHVANHVEIGNNVQIHHNVALGAGVVIEDDVFLGPSCVLTNIINPRSEVRRFHTYEKMIIRKGATIGANATILSGLTIGRYSFIAAGAVVTRDVHDYALMTGVPARRTGWMSRHGYRLRDVDENGITTCPYSGLRYRGVENGLLRCLDLDEAAPLPAAA